MAKYNGYLASKPRYEILYDLPIREWLKKKLF
jgi:hypothetical protein